MPSTMAPTSSEGCPPLSRTHFITAVGRALADLAAAPPSSVRSTPDMRVCAVNGDPVRVAELARAAVPAARRRCLA